MTDTSTWTNTHHGLEMKRSRLVFEGHHLHPLQLRKVVVPESEEEWIQVQEGNAYSCDEDWFQSLSQVPSRPLPSVQILTSIIAPSGGSTAPSTTTFDPRQAPIFQKFYKKVGVTAAGAAKGSSAEAESSSSNLDDAIQNEIDDPSFSTLTKGQHRRYLQLTSSQQTERRKEHERKELKNLTAIVQTEQAKYREALQQFFAKHKDRFRAGFQQEKQHPTYRFCRWASNHQKTINQQWKQSRKLPIHFGKCFQLLSFPSRYSKLLDVDALHFEVVHETQTNMTISKLPQAGSQIKAPLNQKSRNTTTSTWLKDDTVAMELAKQKGASILTTAETLETMLQLPNDSRARWMFFVTTTIGVQQSDTMTILDVPIAEPMMPRQCLELGIQEGINQSRDKVDTSIQAKYVYTLWTLPATTAAMRRQPIRVLVRSTVRMVDEEGIPILIRPHVEYFPERGIEEVSLYEKSLWILDQLLFQHNIQTRMARVDSQTCKILSVEETSVAHALASAANKASNPILHWQTLIQIFQSLPSVGLPEYLLCLPGRDTHSTTASASIHAPLSADSTERSENAIAVNLEESISQAETVVLNQDTLLYCSRDWKWADRERIPYTFPLKGKAKTSKL